MTHANIYIAHDRRLADGRTLIGERLSRPLHRASIAKRVLKRLRRRMPTAYALQVTTF